MTFSLNRIELIGRIGYTPETRTTTTGKTMTLFSVATERPSNPESEAITEWHQIVTFDRLADFASNHLDKGRLIFVAGRIQSYTWTKNGQIHRSTEIVASEIIALDKKPTGEQATPDQNF